LSNSRDYLLNFIRSENAEVRQFQTQYYQYLLDVDKTDGLSMEQHLHQFGHAFVDPTPASNEQLTTLETSFGIKLPNDLITFYQTIGMVAGTDASQAMIFHVHSCKDLLRFFNTDKAYEQLHSLGPPRRNLITSQTPIHGSATSAMKTQSRGCILASIPRSAIAYFFGTKIKLPRISVLT